MQLDTHGERLDNGLWKDRNGFIGPVQPGHGPRSDPIDDHPTGPDIGERLPDIKAPDHAGRDVDVHAERAGGPLAMVFYRSAVW